MAYLIAGLFSGFICSVVAGYKNRSAMLWFFVGAFFPLISLLFLLFMPGNPVPDEQREQVAVRKCPECAEKVLAEARKCKHCGSALEPVEIVLPAPSTKA